MVMFKVNVYTAELPDLLAQRAGPPAAITFLEADLTDNVAAAREAEPRRGLMGLAQANVAEDLEGHGQSGLAGSRRLRKMPPPGVRPTGLPPPCSSAMR